jgi:hypothetical protein
VREESHLDEMRSAIRGDFERLADRRGEQELMRVADDERKPEPEQPPEKLPERESDPEPGSDPEPEREEQRRSWVARLFSPP